MNEFEIIRSISDELSQAPPEVLVSIGDDCAVLRLGGRDWVAASDLLVSEHHFKGWASPEDVGYKAVAINVSDVAAMGGTPRFVLASGGASDSDTTLRCFGGVLEACEGFGVYPLGGDTTRADALTVNVTILGELFAPPVLRSGARPGHLLAVTGELGASAAGFVALENGASGPERLVCRHLRPESRVKVGSVVARLGVGAMIDLSDGLASDVRRICERSGVGCRVDLDLLPIASDTREFLESLGRDPEVMAATGGEDYELLIAAPPSTLDALSKSVETPVTTIGEITDEGAIFRRGNEPVENLSGWDHFSAT
jgi:thiamine-monophosphate kinase